jgi:signal transduction histidine kinase
MDDCTEKKLCASIMVLPDLASIEIAIEDTGCGIREELLSKIFEPYFTEKRDGNGLGLEIIKDVIEKHNGNIVVESQVGIGSKFRVRLPAMQTAELQDSFPHNTEESMRGAYITTQ